MTSLRKRRAEARAQQRAATAPRPRPPPSDAAVAQTITATLQPVLDVFTAAFAGAVADADALQTRVQEVKGLLYARDYAAAFGSDARLAAYVVRWSPARALAYYSLFCGDAGDDSVCAAATEAEGGLCRVLCIGGGAGAEIVALGAVLRRVRGVLGQQGARMEVTAVDIADWTGVVAKLDAAVNAAWFAPEVSTSDDSPSDSDRPFRVKFVHSDVIRLLGADENSAGSARGAAVDALLAAQRVVTTMFTINELFQADRAGTARVLRRLRRACTAPGALLVFVESAGSYSDIQVGARTFPVQFLIHHALTAPAEDGDGAGVWERVYHSDSQWYRIPETAEAALEYPVKLENMRYFVSVYKRQ